MWEEFILQEILSKTDGADVYVLPANVVPSICARKFFM